MRRMPRGCTVLLVAFFAIAGSAAADNLLENPDFDLTPVGNGWTTIGTGSVTHLTSFGEPEPSAQLNAEGTESIVLAQCRPVDDHTRYDFHLRSYTSFASGLSTNEARVRWYMLEGCTGEIGTLSASIVEYPPGEFTIRHRHHVLPPDGAQSARVELEVVANGTATEVYWDAVYLPEPGATSLAFGAIAALAMRRRRS
jgi:hypothetical protein